jgi:peptide-methionine (S)-S-oxide reductase
MSTASSNPFASLLQFAVPALVALAPALCSCAERATVVPPPAFDEPAASGAASETAVLAGGCFWGVQAVFQHVKGVKQAVSGYAGGTRETAEYETVGTGRTGHAESVQITFDPRQISYGRILQIYFSVAHDPTQLNRQGPDHGTQYRSDVFAMSEVQRRVAEQYVAQLGQAGVFPRPIVTRIDPFSGFYPAEGYHQDFATLNPDHPYIVFNDRPKVENLKRLFPDLYRPDAVLVGTTHAAR